LRTELPFQIHSVVIKDAVGDRHIPSSDGTKQVDADTLVNTVCDELGDAFATIINAKDIKA